MHAKRMNWIDPSPTVGIANKVAELKAKGEDIVSFSVGEPDFDTPKHIVDAAKEGLDKGMTHYAPSNGIPEFREAIAEKHLLDNNIPCDAKHVIVAPCKHTIFMTCLAMLEEGDEVLIQDPAWVSYEACVAITGASPIFVDTREHDFHFKPEAIAEAVTPKTKMLILNTPSNPTGIVMSKQELRGIADLAQDHDFYILADEIYEKIIYDGIHHSIASFPELFERTITVNGLSKAYAMTGWRIGWLVAPLDIQKQVAKIQQHSITCIPPFAQHAGIRALTGPVGPVNDMVEEFRARRDLMTKLLNELDTFEVEKPEGAFYLFPKFNSDKSDFDFVEYLLEETRVVVTPGSAFGPSCDKYVRFSYAASRERIKEGIERISVENHEDVLKPPV